MCGIVGIFHQKNAPEQIKSALALLCNRGKDGIGVSNGKVIAHSKDLSALPSLPGTSLLGHTLHAIVDEVPQPLQGKGTLVANCEIYNWRELNKKYQFNAKNDAELLLHFLDTFSILKLEELDGVFAFAYWRDNTLYLARDILGEKPIWYSYNADYFAFASEKKILEKLNYLDLQELNPRQILIYDIKSKEVQFQSRSFFSYLPEHKEPYVKIKEKTKALLDQAIQKRIPPQKFGLLFSGGIDSTYLAHYFKEHGYDITCYTAVLETNSVTPSDLIAAQEVAQKLNLKHKIQKITLDKVSSYLQKIVPLIEDSNVVKVGVALPFFLACEEAKKDGCKVIFSGLGSEEIFTGYERHKQSANINQECVSGLLKMYERDLYRDDVVTMFNGLELRLPFLDKELVSYALKIPEKYKIKDNTGKLILREIAQEKGIPAEFAFRKKTAAQYGSRFDYALAKLAKQNKYLSKSAYLRTFYFTHNLRLGVLFSGGKDSTYAAYIMQKQNYEITCLITLRSENKDSYMFHTPAIEMTSLQAEAMGIPLVTYSTQGEKESELQDLEKAISLAKKKYQIDGIVTGALFSTYQRDRIERICDKLGLKIFSPLWHKHQEQHLRQLLQEGFEIVLSSVAAEGLGRTWVGRKLDTAAIQDLEKLHSKYQLNVAGEGGEYESLVLDCHLFKKKIILEEVEIEEEHKNTVRLLIKKAWLGEK